MWDASIFEGAWLIDSQELEFRLPNALEVRATVENLNYQPLKLHAASLPSSTFILQAPAEKELVKQPTNVGNNSDQPSKKRKQTSNIWDHFVKKGTGKKATGRCRYCQKPMDAKTTNGTTLLWRHLNRCADYLSSKGQTLLNVNKSSQGSTSSTWVFSQKASREFLTWMIIAHEHWFTLIKQPLFRAFVESLQPKFKLLSRGTLKTNIMALYKLMKGKLAIDHYITDWTLKKQVLAFKELPAPHTGVNIADLLMSTILDWKLVDKVAFITVDNVSSNDVTVSRVCSALSSRSSVPPDMEGKFFHVRCAAHIINLIVKDSPKILSGSIDKICNSVRHTTNSSSRKQLFKEAIAQANMKTRALPSVDVPTRWNSTYLMLKSSLPYKDTFNSLAIQDANYTDCLTSPKWEELATMHDFLNFAAWEEPPPRCSYNLHNNEEDR
ncbi:hypothetical protein MJO28_014958 [Puccinia striiformis f. sp. tritici]|uniref:Uncharacterized protein n=1 Tax=Puccinia striiformis f. sp. tritici TaxID=168172 RepID=A0ACC0DU58_9BASI|nr:hypothetical protein MJO28_014958 [Puccinia striiformis f. sp. tritici]